jgi:hypothetical protein
MLSSNMNLREPRMITQNTQEIWGSSRVGYWSSGLENNQEIVRNSPQPYQAKMRKVSLQSVILLDLKIFIPQSLIYPRL